MLNKGFNTKLNEFLKPHLNYIIIIVSNFKFRFYIKLVIINYYEKINGRWEIALRKYVSDKNFSLIGWRDVIVRTQRTGNLKE